MSSSLYPGTLPILLRNPEDPKSDLLPLILQIRIWARPSAIDQGHGDYALKVTGPILSFFAQHYNTSYPLPKSGKCPWGLCGGCARVPIQMPPVDTWIPSTDQIALPDFNAGAMENWGLVTYRESSLAFDPLSSSISNQERVVTVIAHELAHQVGHCGRTKKEQALRCQVLTWPVPADSPVRG